jgi:hypothetical protein
VPWVRDRIETKCPRCKERNVAWRAECRLCAAPLRAQAAPRAASDPARDRPAERAEPGYSPR